MTDIPEWVEASDGSYLHRTTIANRLNDLGWSRDEATSRPVRDHSRNAEESIAKQARADLLTPGKVQTLMRLYGTTYEETRDYLRQHGE